MTDKHPLDVRDVLTELRFKRAEAFVALGSEPDLTSYHLGRADALEQAIQLLEPLDAR